MQNQKLKFIKKYYPTSQRKLRCGFQKKIIQGGFAVYDEKDQEIKKYDPNKISYEDSYSEKLDNIYKIKNEKIALKIDVERHEKNVILGAEKILSSNKVLLQIELFDHKKDEIEFMLKKMNFYFIKSNKKDNFYSNFNDSN